METLVMLHWSKHIIPTWLDGIALSQHARGIVCKNEKGQAIVDSPWF